MAYYTTMTSKGQITIPAAIRQKLELLSGRKYRVRSHGNQVIIEKQSMTDFAKLRAETEKIMRENGTWGTPLSELRDRAWDIHIKEKYGKF